MGQVPSLRPIVESDEQTASEYTFRTRPAPHRPLDPTKHRVFAGEIRDGEDRIVTAEKTGTSLRYLKLCGDGEMDDEGDGNAARQDGLPPAQDRERNDDDNNPDGIPIGGRPRPQPTP